MKPAWLALLPALPSLLGAATAWANVPAFETLRAAHAPSDVALLDRHGAPLQLLRVDSTVRRGPWLTLADMSPALRSAIVLSEDRRFWDHGGVDWRALAGSAWANAWNQRTRGASTLTMQLAGLTDEQLVRPAGGRSVAGKLSQMQRARGFEAAWSKAQILEAYLNRVPLRGELVGVAAAANVLFGKHASGLDSLEAALLAAMVRAPNAGATVVEKRACDVLRQQQQSCDGLAITLSQALARKPGPLSLDSGEGIAPHLARHIQRTLKPQPGGPPLLTTIDARLQRLALVALRQQLAELRGRNVEDGAVLVLDNSSGDVLAWVGSSGPGSAAPEVDAVLARRQPGSTLKPFVYALALQRRLITAASQLDDSPLQLAAGSAVYQPQNYDHAYKGLVSVRQALAGSLNVPAVRVGAMLGPDALFDSFNRAGLHIGQSAGHHGHALALGSAEVSLLSLSNAYRMLANGGRFSAVRWLAGTRDRATPQPVFDAAVSHIVADMLADPAARAASFGLDSPLVTRGWAAVKTGTSKDMRDNWCLGFSSRYTVGVWVGNVSGAAMHGVSGVSGAAPVWRELMLQLHGDAVSRPPPPPAGLVDRDGEWFLPGTAPGPIGRSQAFGVHTPQPGSVIVLDPDIPQAAQRLLIQGAPGVWRIDGRQVGQGTLLHWLPRPGRHVLERLPLNGGEIDQVEFEVRAAPPPRRASAARAQRAPTQD